MPTPKRIEIIGDNVRQAIKESRRRDAARLLLSVGGRNSFGAAPDELWALSAGFHGTDNAYPEHVPFFELGQRIRVEFDEDRL